MNEMMKLRMEILLTGVLAAIAPTSCMNNESDADFGRRVHKICTNIHSGNDFEQNTNQLIRIRTNLDGGKTLIYYSEIYTICDENPKILSIWQKSNIVGWNLLADDVVKYGKDSWDTARAIEGKQDKDKQN